MKRTLVSMVLLGAAGGAWAGDVPQKVPVGALIFVESGETVDASNSTHKAANTDFGIAIAAALRKKQVPVTVVTDVEKADYIIKQTSSASEDSTGTKIAKLALFGGLSGGFHHFEGSMSVVHKESTAVVFSYNVKKSNFQSAADSFAKHLKNHMAGQE